MTAEEQAAADAAKVKADAEAKAKAEADAKDKGQKTYSEEAFKQLIAERDAAKEKARLYDEEKAKAEAEAKKASDEKAIAEGNAKKLLAEREAALTEAQKKLTAYEEADKATRQAAIGRLTDPKLKEVAEKLPTTADVLGFVELATNSKVNPFNANPQKTEGEPKKYKSAYEWAKDLQAQGKA
jgi:hypothetical protein